MNFSGVPGPRGSAEVSTGEDEWGHEGPSVEEEADPAGADLDPHSWPLPGHVLELGVRAVPAGHGHHDVQGSQEQHEVEHGVVVLNSLFLVVHNPPRLALFFVAGTIGSCVTKDHTFTA